MYRPITMYQIVCDRFGEVFGGYTFADGTPFGVKVEE